MQNTRQRVVETLRVQRAATAREIGRALQITPADARHHLTNLLKEGVIVPIGKPPGQGRGRPAQRYRLASDVQTDPYELLAPALLAEALERLPVPERDSFLRSVIARLGNYPKPSGSLTARLVGTIHHLGKLGYKSRWEARAAGPHLILERRPFEALMTRQPGSGELDVYLLEALLGAPVQRLDEQGVYEVGRSSI
jgi:predicted ArsR family transcriptional regulator